MNKRMVFDFTRWFCVLISIGVVSGCGTSPRERYGDAGINRAKISHIAAPETRAAKIDDVIAKYGSRNEAVNTLIEAGFSLYRSDRLGEAMNSFNKAWTLDPTVPDVYHGFASILLDRRQHCEGSRYMQKVLSITSDSSQGYHSDTATAMSRCARLDSSISSAEREALIAEAKEMHEFASSNERDRSYAYNAWAVTLYVLNEFTEASRVVQEAQAQGIQIDPQLLSDLRQKQ